MGQTESSSSSTTPNPNPTTTVRSPPQPFQPQSNGPDLTTNLPDEVLSLIFHSLSPSDRNRCSLVSKTWLRIDSQSRHRLSLIATSDISPFIPTLFTRFNSVTKLALKSDRRSISINDQDLTRISLTCPNLTRLKLRGCRQLTHIGINSFGLNCRNIKKLSIGSLAFGSKGINAVVTSLLSLEELSVKRLRGDGAVEDRPIDPIGSRSLKTISLKEIYNGQCFGDLIIGSKNLKSLRLVRCSGDWDYMLENIVKKVTGLVEIHLERIQVSDIGLLALSGCRNLEILHIVKTPEVTNVGLKAVAEKCRVLRKLHVDGWKTNRIGDDGLLSVGRNCVNLQELVLIGVNPTVLSLGVLATNCVKLERLALCGSDTVGDTEISIISTKCVVLKKLCIKGCVLTDLGMEALANGCPNLVKVKVKKCKGVTIDGADWFKASRRSVIVNLDVVERENNEGDVGEIGLDVAGVVVPAVGPSTGRSRSFKARLNLVSGTFKRWSSYGGSSSRNI